MSMSDRERNYVWDHSPYSGTAKLIHLQMAELANEGHQFRLWAGDRFFAAKACCDEKTVRRARARMIEDGLLLENGRDDKTGNREYVFVVPEERLDILTGGSSESLVPVLVSTQSRDANREAEFDECWAVYPRKLARKAALTAYLHRRKAGAKAEDLLTCTTHYAQAMVGTEPQFVLHGATFYGPKDRWVDYLSAASAIPANSQPIVPIGPKSWNAIQEVMDEQHAAAGLVSATAGVLG